MSRSKNNLIALLKKRYLDKNVLNKLIWQKLET